MPESLPKTQPDREVDIEVVAAGRKGNVRTSVIFPSTSTIYGIANTSLVRLGVQNPYSQQIPGLIETGIDRNWAVSSVLAYVFTEEQLMKYFGAGL
ncbi:hypothetical protein DEU56DRAFT_918304 [Suillus clintonianus]|uniref:uncharacterized protein n=1 Tax=Suillus clintonianus TaxID=1904413 RepID=UPI001B86D994|nr:uncharacterized protein DEU56DRAFT_918304 [Suillus clintonianus]KAG2121228.1 hypothetical protein DEU56DRAFT_918304 [Suillus clintonianus]